jgi:tetratricopeptide (TPR) repeat protein
MQDDLSEDSFARGVALQQAQRFAEAAEVYRQVARTRLTSNLACNLGVCLGELGDWAGAAHYLELATRHQPANAEFHRRLGSVYAEAGQGSRAEQEYRAALAAKPGDLSAELSLAALYLSLGRYAEGWPLLAARIPLHPDVVPPINLRYPEWRGQPLEGRSVLVWVEQGFGDQIQMCRFVSGLKARGAARVTLGCRPALAHLFTTLAGADSVIPVATGASVSVPPHDYWSRYFSLPGALGVTLENLPAEPYLAAPADRLERWSHAKGVGLVWQASPTGFNAGNKGLPTEVARRILDRGAMSLHPEDTGARDFADTAAIIARLDLVISIDTSVAHLAGAMGKPCWTLLPYVHADWRWLRERADSPWYPSLKLYRQTRPRDWSETIDHVLRDL